MDKNEDLLRLLEADEVCVIPTDTVYGVVGKLSSERAVAKIYDIKKRDLNKPVGTILAGSIEQVAALTTASVLDLAATYWPGPVSIILPASPAYQYAHKGEMSLAIRIPDNQALQALLLQTGPLASSSANIQGQPPATTMAEAERYFGDAVSLYIDGGDLSARLASKIIRIDANGVVEMVRE